jgi:hypothetical protein
MQKTQGSQTIALPFGSTETPQLACKAKDNQLQGIPMLDQPD